MDATSYLLDLIVKARAAVMEAGPYIERYVSPERGALTRKEVRRHYRRADRRLTAAYFCACTCALESCWAQDDFGGIVSNLKDVMYAFGEATTCVECWRFKRNERRAEACAALCEAYRLFAEVEETTKTTLGTYETTRMTRFKEFERQRAMALQGGVQ